MLGVAAGVLPALHDRPVGLVRAVGPDRCAWRGSEG